MTGIHGFVLGGLCILAACANVDAADPQPLIVAHRGLLRHAPENTLANFKLPR